MRKTEERVKTGRMEQSAGTAGSGRTARGAFWWKKRSAGKIRPARTGRRRVHRQVKDRLFRFLFEKDREALLQLYNTLNGTAYSDASQLQVVTIESAVYMVMKNDLAFVLAEFLRKYRAEVLGMLLEEFDVKKYERSIREEVREEESARYSKLICILLEQHREDDLRRAAKEPEYREQLYQEFGF